MLPIKKYGVFTSLVLLFVLAFPSYTSAYWFRTVSGNVHSNGKINIGLNAPTGTYLSISDPDRGSSGIITYTNTTTFNDGDGSESGALLGEQWIQRLLSDAPTTYKNILSQYNYAYFKGRLSGYTTDSSVSSYCNNGSSGVVHFNSSVQLYCNSNTSDNNGVGYGKEVGPNPGQDLILLVNGDVTIADTTNVPNSSFFMVVSSGTITIDDQIIGTSTDPGIQGIFIADRIVTSDVATGNQLFAEGIFVAHTDFVFRRQNLNNNLPSEIFMYKPSLFVAAPTLIWDTFDGYEEIEP